MEIKRGEIYYSDLNPSFGSEQGGIRPVLILSNDKGNKHSPTVTVAAITSKNKPPMPTHISICGFGLTEASTVMLEQIRTIDKKRLSDYIGQLDELHIEKVNQAISVSFGLE